MCVCVCVCVSITVHTYTIGSKPTHSVQSVFEGGYRDDMKNVGFFCEQVVTLFFFGVAQNTYICIVVKIIFVIIRLSVILCFVMIRMYVISRCVWPYLQWTRIGLSLL